MDPLVTSTLISAGSSLLGSVFGGKKKGPSLEDIQNANVRQEDMLFDSRMENAKQHGIHPLVMLGIPPSGGGTFGFSGGESSEPSKFEKMAEMGQGISRAAHAWLTREEREMGKISAQLQLENQALQNDRLRSEIALLHQPGSPPGQSAFATTDPRYPGRQDLPLGADAASPRYLPLVNPDGSITTVTSPNAGDNEILMLWDFITKTAPDEFKNMLARDVKKMRAWLNKPRRRNQLGEEMTKFRK
jgi:hypothetical protein